MTSKRLLGGFVLPAVLFGLAVVPFLLLRDRLPDPLAIHWEWGGAADDSMSQTVVLVLVAVLVGLGSIGLTVLAVAPPMQRGARGVLAWSCAFFASLFAGVSVLTVRANLDLETWTEAEIGVGWVLGMCVLAIGIGALSGYLLLRDDDLSAVDGPGRLPTAGIRSGDRATWLGACQSRWMYALGAFMLVVSVIAGVLAELMLGVVMAVSALAVMAFGSIRVATNQRGLTVWYTPLAWPRTQVPLDRIVAAEAIDVSPMKHGGWGYRGSLKLFGMAAIVLRKGEGIRLELDNGKLFVVTVDDAQTGAGVLNDLLGLSPTP